jgi:hypothetical protein
MCVFFYVCFWFFSFLILSPYRGKVRSDESKNSLGRKFVNWFFKNNSGKFSGDDSTGKNRLRFAPCHRGERVAEFAAPLKSEFAFVTYLMPRKIGGKFRFCPVENRLPDHRETDKHCLTLPRPN